jgi:hypothetical protein
MQPGHPMHDSDNEAELQQAIRASLEEEEREREELELALAQSLQFAEQEKKKADLQAKKDREQREKEAREEERRRKLREQADSERNAEEVVEVVTLSVFWLVLLLSDDELLLRAMRDYDVVVDVPPLSAEDESFLVITGRSRRGVDGAKRMLLERLEQEQERSRNELVLEAAGPAAPPLASVVSPPRAPARKSETHIFVDSSNILIGAQVKIDVPAFCRLVEGDRAKIVARFAVGSHVKGYGNLETIWKGCGYGARGFQLRGKEELHDDALQNMISALLFQGIKGRGERGGALGKTIVLCTGDGNRHGREKGGQDFPSLVRVALTMGFEVEVWAWRAGCSNSFRKFLNSEKFSLFFLDDYLETLAARK